MSGNRRVSGQARLIRCRKVPPAASDGAAAQRHSSALVGDRLCVMRDGLVGAALPAGKLGQKWGRRRYYRVHASIVVGQRLMRHDRSRGSLRQSSYAVSPIACIVVVV